MKQKIINHMYKMRTEKQIDTKNELIIFIIILLILKVLIQSYKQLTKNHVKTLVFTILKILQLKKLMIVKIFTVLIPYICVLIMWMGISKKMGKINVWFLILQMKLKMHQKNVMIFGMESKTKSKQ